MLQTPSCSQGGNWTFPGLIHHTKKSNTMWRLFLELSACWHTLTRDNKSSTELYPAMIGFQILIFCTRATLTFCTAKQLSRLPSAGDVCLNWLANRRKRCVLLITVMCMARLCFSTLKGKLKWTSLPFCHLAWTSGPGSWFITFYLFENTKHKPPSDKQW